MRRGRIRWGGVGRDGSDGKKGGEMSDGKKWGAREWEWGEIGCDGHPSGGCRRTRAVKTSPVMEGGETR